VCICNAELKRYLLISDYAAVYICDGVWMECRIRCGRCQARHREASADSLATYSKSSCHLRSLYASRASPSLPASTASCLHQLHHYHHYHQHQQQPLQQAAATAHLCPASSPHHEQLSTHCQIPTCLYSRRPCRHGDASACRCIRSSTADDEEDSDSPRRRCRLKPLLATDTDTQTDAETDDRPPDDVDQLSPDSTVATHRLLMTSSDQLPVTSDVITAYHAAELILAWVRGAYCDSFLFHLLARFSVVYKRVRNYSRWSWEKCG